MSCNNCGSINMHTDNSQGLTYCVSCGMVQDENIMVSTLNFVEEGSKTTMQGKIIDLESKQVGTTYVESSYFIKNTIRNICSSLGIGNDVIECSYRYYKLLLPYNLSKGKSILYTLSVCVYITCRQEKRPNMLMDFSCALGLDVFKIGRTFLKIVNALALNIPSIDPSLYIHRFACKLKLKNPKITHLALRIVSRMERDWIVVGRRPNNLCGAALVIASRIHNEARSVFDVAKVVHVSESTINKRLREFEDTQTANMSVKDFIEKWIEDEEDPPILKEKVKKQKSNANLEESKDGSISQPQSNSVCQFEYLEEPFLDSPKSQFDVDTQNIHNTNKEVQKDKSCLDNATNVDQEQSLVDKNSSEYGFSPNLDKENILESSSKDKDEGFMCDDDVKQYILNDKEVEIRTNIWESMYDDFLKERDLKRLNAPKPKRRNNKKECNTVSDVLKSLNKRISSKLNYQVIEKMFDL